jgi:WD repeat-containing protein 23
MSVRFSPGGDELLVGAKDNCVYIYDIATSKPILRLRGHTDEVNAICYGDSNSPHLIYSGSDDTTIKVWDRRSIADGRPAGVFTGHTEGITFVHSKGDGRYVLSNGKDQQMKLWDLRFAVLGS